MAGYLTFNATDKPMRVMIYNEPEGLALDGGEVAPRRWRAWHLGRTANRSCYTIRAEWPAYRPKVQTHTTNSLDGASGLTPYALFGGEEAIWWDRPSRPVDSRNCPMGITLAGAATQRGRSA